MFSPVEEADDLELIPVCPTHDMFIAGKPFLHLKDAVLPLAEIARLPIICPEKGTSTRQYLDAFFRSHGVVLDPEFELATTVLIVPFVERGLGVGITVRRFAEASLRRGTVFEITPEHSIPERSIVVATRKKTPLSHAGRAFIRWLTGQERLRTAEGRSPVEG